MATEWTGGATPGDYMMTREQLEEAARDRSLTDATVRMMCIARHGTITAEIGAWADEVIRDRLAEKSESK